MKAIQIREFSDDADLFFVEIPEPQPKEGEVLIEVKAAGVNYADILMRRGSYAGRHPLPFVPGFEAAGVVLRVGKGVSDWSPGQRVMGTVLRETSGCYAKNAVMPAWLLLPMPDDFTFEEGAAFSEVFITAYLALQVLGRVAAGESVLIHAAAGGVGTAAVQVARAAGARVFATASSDEKLQRVKELGADVLINYAQKDFEAEVAKTTGGKGVEIVLESVGGEVFEKSLRCLRTLGRLVVYGVSSGEPNTLRPLDLLQRAISVSGFSFGGLCHFRPDIVRQAMRGVMELFAQHKIRSIVGHRFPLADARTAHQLISSRKNFGKVVLLP